MESLVKSVCIDMLDKDEKVVDYFWKASGVNEQPAIARNLISKDYIRFVLKREDIVRDLKLDWYFLCYVCYFVITENKTVFVKQDRCNTVLSSLYMLF